MIRAALDVFGRHGFDGATTRMLAQQAGMNLGAIPYYFGSKDDLYAQAAQYLGQYIEARQTVLLSDLARATQGVSQREALCDHVVAFLTAQAHALLSQNIPVSWMQFFLRAQGETGPAFEHLNRQVITPAQQVVVPLIARIVGRSTDDPVTLTLTFLGIHQALYIRLADSTLMRRMNWDAITPERMSELLAIVGTAIKAQLMNYPRS